MSKLGELSFTLPREASDNPPRNNILSITPSETFHIEDDFELTPAERMEAEQMQKEEQLRRRDPKAHTVLISGRRERGLRQSQHVSLHSMPPVVGTQQVRYGAPVVDIVDMPCATSMAPDATPGVESVLKSPIVASCSVAETRNPNQSKSELLSSSTSETGQGASMQSSFVTPQHASGTSQFTTHDLQRQIDGFNLFPKQNQRDKNVSDQPDQSDGQMEKTPVAAKQKSTHHKHGPGHSNGVKEHTTEMTGAVNGFKENKGVRKRSVTADDENMRKRTKRASAPMTELLHPEAMFEKLLQIEASRASRGDS